MTRSHKKAWGLGPALVLVMFLGALWWFSRLLAHKKTKTETITMKTKLFAILTVVAAICYVPAAQSFQDESVGEGEEIQFATEEDMNEMVEVSRKTNNITFYYSYQTVHEPVLPVKIHFFRWKAKDRVEACKAIAIQHRSEGPGAFTLASDKCGMSGRKASVQSGSTSLWTVYLKLPVHTTKAVTTRNGSPLTTLADAACTGVMV